MDRVLVYTAELPRSADFLQAQKNALYGLGYLAQAVLGPGTVVSGLACTPTSPASLQVQIGPGAIYAQASVDATAFSTLGTDGNTITKQGLSPTVQTLTITPPTTSGYSQIYLVEACYTDSDTGASVLPYYNAANPAAPYSGPSNAGTSQNTARQGICTITLKAGAAAATGSQVAPTVDAGYVPLWLIGVANGQTTITSANISRHPNCPLAIAVSAASLQQHVYVYAADSGAANAYAASYSPAVTALTDGLTLEFKAAHANTGASTFSPSGLTAVPIYGETHQPLIGGEIVVNGFVQLEYNSSLNGGTGAWVLLQNTGGASHVVTAPQFTNNIQPASTAFVQRALGNYNYVSYNAATTLTLAQAGYYIDFFGTSTYTVTLPLPTTSSGVGFIIYTTNTSGITLTTPIGAIYGISSISSGYGNAKSSVFLPQGTTITVVNDGSNWNLISQNPNLGSSLGANGYQKLSSGLIVQWGTTAIPMSQPGIGYFPIAFPNGCFGMAGCDTSAGGYSVAFSATATLFGSYARSGGTYVSTTATYLAWGN